MKLAGAIMIGVGLGMIACEMLESLMAKHEMPPGYFLQTDGHYWRWYAIERGGWWTNTAEFESRKEAYLNARGVAKMNSIRHEWKDSP